MSLEPSPSLKQVLDRCASTNDLLKEAGHAGAPHGSWISSRVQDAGRGRMGRKWESEPGNLFLSLIVRDLESSLWTWIPLTAAVAIGEFLTRKLKIPARIKWPNDLVLADSVGGYSKLGGILCEGLGGANGAFVVVGVGLNCLQGPEGLEIPTTSLTAILKQPIGADQVRDEIRTAILEAMADLARSGYEEMRTRYEALALYQPGTWIEWSEGGVLHSAQVLGLGAFGELRVLESAQNKPRALYAEDIRARPVRA